MQIVTRPTTRARDAPQWDLRGQNSRQAGKSTFTKIDNITYVDSTSILLHENNNEISLRFFSTAQEPSKHDPLFQF